MDGIAVALTGLFDKIFSAKVIGPALRQVGLTIGDEVFSNKEFNPPQ